MSKLDWDKINKNRTGLVSYKKRKLRQHPKLKASKSFQLSCKNRNSEMLADYESSKVAFETTLKIRLEEKRKAGLLVAGLRYRCPKKRSE